MFQRLRDAIDSRIAEEQARQRSSQEALARSNSARRPATRNLSPNRRRPRRNTGTPVRGPDPNEFEPEFAIGDDEGSSRSATPRNEPAGEEAEGDEKKTGVESAGNEAQEEPRPAPELPPEVRAKLRKLDRLESRYQDLLKAYRTAHSRVLSIEPFEAALRENTPLTSIGDPKALTEYLNQMSLKSDMVVEELKRITTEKDDHKKKAEEAEKSAKEAWDEVANLKNNVNNKEKSDNLAIDTSVANDSSDAKSPTPSVKDRVAGLLSPKKDAAEAQPQESEEFFSFDGEIPRLESELKEKQEEVETLKSQAEQLKRDLGVARESTEGMVQNLETATRELVELRDIKDKQDADIESLKSSKQTELDDLKSKLATAEAAVETTNSAVEKLKNDLKEKTDELERAQAQAPAEDTAGKSELTSKLEEAKKEKESTEKRLGVLQGLVDSLKSQLKATETTVADLKTDVGQKTEAVNKLQKVVDFLDGGLKDNASWKSAKDKVTSGQQANFDEFLKSLAPQEKSETSQEAPKTAEAHSQPAPAAGGGGKKKKNNKKKKGGKAAEESKPAAPTPEKAEPSKAESSQPSPNLDELQEKIETLTVQLGEKEAAIDRLSTKLKGEEDLKEEIESLRDDLLHIGQDHVEAKDKIKELSAQKTALEETISKLEKELTDLRTSSASQTADSDKLHGDLKNEYENLKVKSAGLETDLSAAQQLAATRFKDLTDLRETMQKLQPELRNLRAESAELKSTKDVLTSKSSELKTLEGKHDDMRAELKKIKSMVSERDAEVKTLNQKIRQETDSRLKAEEGLSVAQSDLRYSESKKQEAVEAKEKTATDLSKAQDDLKAARTKARSLEDKASQLNRDLNGLRDEIQLKTAQHASAQSLMNNMRDQVAEMGMQMKEARERCESLEEELADAHRLLSERTREGETMRRLLNDIEGRADAKVRDFKERMEAAIEERDRAEDEASSQGRRRARELEELKTKVREAEKQLRTAEEDKEELEHSQKEWRRRRDELDAQSERSTNQLNAVREDMSRLRSALDESEKQVRDLEKEKAELRRSVEETNNRLEKLRKSSKVLSEESRNVSTPKIRGMDSGNQSSRSSIDSGSRRGLASPIRSPSNMRMSESSGPSIDYLYLKNVLLQFLEQKDRSNQKQLIPVLGMLLHFDRNDEQKWMAAISK